TIPRLLDVGENTLRWGVTWRCATARPAGVLPLCRVRLLRGGGGRLFGGDVRLQARRELAGQLAGDVLDHAAAVLRGGAGDRDVADERHLRALAGRLQVGRDQRRSGPAPPLLAPIGLEHDPV